MRQGGDACATLRIYRLTFRARRISAASTRAPRSFVAVRKSFVRRVLKTLAVNGAIPVVRGPRARPNRREINTGDWCTRPITHRRLSGIVTIDTWPRSAFCQSTVTRDTRKSLQRNDTRKDISRVAREQSDLIRGSRRGRSRYISPRINRISVACSGTQHTYVSTGRASLCLFPGKLS